LNKKRMVIFDQDETYAGSLMEYLESMQNFPYTISVFSEKGALLAFAAQTAVSLLLVSETAYALIRNEIKAEQVMILNESGTLTWKELHNIKKYQSANHIVKEIMHYYAEKEEIVYGQLTVKGNARMIGLYSPVRRCSQTTLGLTLGQILAEENKTLYLNFENFSGFPNLIGYERGRDLSDLLYFLEKSPEKFRFYFETCVRKMENLDYIPPIHAMHQLLMIRGEQWLSLLQAITKETDYDVVILDLSEGMQGLFEVLRMCTHVYTLTQDDRYAKAKVDQYEQLLQLCEYEDVLQKTIKRKIPFIKDVTERFLYRPGGEFSEYVKKMLKDDGLNHGLYSN